MKDYLKIIEENKDEMLTTLKELVAIPSVVTKGEGDMPFGKEVQRAYDFVMDMAKKDGFVTRNVDNYGGHIDFPGETDEIVAVVGHLDVVPEGDLTNWKTKPYEAVIADGRMYGRGTVDDKGPLISGYYAVKALKQAGFRPDKTIRIILGLDEETEWKGMDYYMRKENPDIVAGFSPDAEFPAIHAEKGLLIFDIFKKFSSFRVEGLRVLSLEGGTVPNAVADNAVCEISSGDKKEYVIKKITDYVAAHDYDISFVEEGENIKITAKGVSSHAAYPENGLNAISIMFELLGEIQFENEEMNRAVAFYNNYIGFNLHGEKIGIQLEDEPSGNLAFNVGIARMNQEEIRLTINVRYPVTFDIEDVYAGIEAVTGPLEYKVERVDYQPPLYKSVDDILIKTLMETYRKYTGDDKSKPLVIGGATYARAVPNTVAFGPVMPGRPDLCHQANEYIDLEDLFTSTKIFAEALYKLAK